MTIQAAVNESISLCETYCVSLCKLTIVKLRIFSTLSCLSPLFPAYLCILQVVTKHL